MLIPYWNHAGEVHQLEPYPTSFQEWAQGEEIPEDQHALHDAVKALIHRTIVRTSCRAMDMNIVRLTAFSQAFSLINYSKTLDATLDDGASIIIRQRHSDPSDPVFEKWSQGKFQNEVGLLRWLRKNCSLPVPSILALGTDFMIQEKMPGSTLALQWHFWSDSAKVCTHHL